MHELKHERMGPRESVDHIGRVKEREAYMEAEDNRKPWLPHGQGSFEGVLFQHYLLSLSHSLSFSASLTLLFLRLPFFHFRQRGDFTMYEFRSRYEKGRVAAWFILPLWKAQVSSSHPYSLSLSPLSAVLRRYPIHLLGTVFLASLLA